MPFKLACSYSDFYTYVIFCYHLVFISFIHVCVIYLFLPQTRACDSLAVLSSFPEADSTEIMHFGLLEEMNK